MSSSDRGSASQVPLRSGVGARIGAALIALGCVGVLALAAWLSPDPDGFGTHTQLKMTPCTWVVLFGKPCPTCGMTTSFAHAAEAQPIASFRAQPLGSFLAYATGAMFWLSAHIACTGSRLHQFNLGGIGRRIGWLFVAGLIASWLYKLATWPGA